MEDKINSILLQLGQKLIHSIQIKLRVGPAKSDRIAVLSNTYFSIFQKTDCKKSFLWIELSSIKVTDKDVTLRFGKNVFHIFPSDLKLFLSCIFDVIQRVLLPSELEKLEFDTFHSFVALPNPFSVSSRIRMKIQESNTKYDQTLVQSVTDSLSYTRKDLNLSSFDVDVLPFIIDAIPLYYGVRSIKISSSGKVDAFHYVSKLASEKTNLRLIDVKGYSNNNFDNYMANLSLNKSPKLLTLSFESSFFQQSQLNLLKDLFRKSNLKGLEFHDAISPQAFDFFHDAFFLSLNLKTLNLDGTRGLNLPRILILVPGLVLLSLESCDLDISDVIVQIQNLHKLRSINLSGNRCTNSTKLNTPLPPNVLSVYVNNVTWEKHCLVQFFKYRLMKLSISYISASSDEWQQLFDSLPNNQNNTLGSITWDGNNLHSNFFNYLKNQICLNYLSLNDCFTQNHPECLSYLIDYLRYKDLPLTEISLRGTESNNMGEYLVNILNIIMKAPKIDTIDVYGQRGGDQCLITIMENIGNMKVISCDKMNPSKSAILFDLADKAKSYQVLLSYPSEDISLLVHLNKMSKGDSRSLYNKFRMLPKRIKKQPPRVLYPPPSSSAFDFPFQVYKFHPQNEFPRYLKEKQLAFYEKAPPMTKVAPSIKLPNGQKQVILSPSSQQSQPQQQPQSQPQIQQLQQQQAYQPPPQQSYQPPSQQSYQPPPQQSYQPPPQPLRTTFVQQELISPKQYNYNQEPTFPFGSPNNQINQNYNKQTPSNYRMDQTINNNNRSAQNSNRNSPSNSRNRPPSGNTSPNSIYKETMRPPPPRFVFEDDPITLEMSREDETILPTIDEEFYPLYNDNNNNNNNNNNNYKYNYNDNNINRNNRSNNNSTTNRESQRKNQYRDSIPNQSRSRNSPSKNTNTSSRPQKRKEIPEEEDIFDYDGYEDDNYNKPVQRNSRRRHYENENEDSNEERLRRLAKSRAATAQAIRSPNDTSGRRGTNHRSSSRQHHNRQARNNRDNNDYDAEEDIFDNRGNYDDDDETQRRRRQSRSRNIPSSDRVRKNKPRLYYNDEGDFEDSNRDYDYDDENEFKKQPNINRRITVTNHCHATASKSPSPYSKQRQRQTQSQRPKRTQPQPSHHQRSDSNRPHYRRSNRNRNYNEDEEIDDVNENGNYDDEEKEYSDENEIIYLPKAQSQRRNRIVHQQSPKKQRKGQSHRPRAQKLRNDDFNNDYDDENDNNNDEDDDEKLYRPSHSRSHNRHQTRNQMEQPKKKVQRRPAPMDPVVTERKRPKVGRNQNDGSSPQQSHNRNRNRNINIQRTNNYNKDFEYDYDNNNDYDNDYVNDEDEGSLGYSAKRKRLSQRSSSQSQSKRQNSDSHRQRIVRKLNRDGSPKPSRRPAPKYVKEFTFSSTNSYE